MSWCNVDMDIQDIRRKVLAALIEKDTLAVAAKKFGKPDRQLLDMIKKRKSFGEKVAREMEKNYAPERPPGWLDVLEKKDALSDKIDSASIIKKSVAKIEESMLKIEESVAQQMAVCNAYRDADDESKVIVDYILSDPRDPPPGWVTNEMKDHIDAMRYAVIKWRRSQQKKSS